MEFEQGKVYLKNIRTGDIHLYERYMAHNKNYEAIVPNPIEQVEDQPLEIDPDPNAAQTGSTQQPGSA